MAPPVHPVTTRSHFGLPVPALDAGDQAAEWFSALVGAPSRLVRMASPAGWRLPGDLDVFGQAAPFNDAAPILVTADASLGDLRVRASEPFGMDRFRPNPVLTGSEPWAEDTWTDLRVGEAALRVVTPWPRGAIPQIGQQTGERHRAPGADAAGPALVRGGPGGHGRVAADPRGPRAVRCRMLDRAGRRRHRGG